MARIYGAQQSDEPPEDNGDIYGRGGGGSAGAPPPPSTTSTPLGVPSGYKAEVPLTANEHYYPSGYNYNQRRWGSTRPSDLGTYEQSPRYNDGDQYLPRYGWDEEQITILQHELARIGLLNGRFIGGVWDQASADAYAAVLSYANQQGLSDTQAMSEMLNSQGFRVDSNGNIIPLGTGTAIDNGPLVIQHMDPEAVKGTLRRSAIEMLGIGLTEDQINSMYESYAQMESDRQRVNFEAQNAESGTFEVTNIPTPDQYAESQIHDQFGEREQVYNAEQTAAEAAQYLSSTPWGIG